MRLAQLARKLSINQSEIVAFLAANNVQIEDNANTKLLDEHAQVIIKHYAPHLQLSITEEIPAPEAEMLIEEDINIPVTEPGVEELTSEPAATEVRLSTELIEEKSEIIRAPKVELTGLKVLGKIELPEKKKKEDAEKSEATNREAEEIPEVGKKIVPYREVLKYDRKKGSPRPAKNPLAIARERELAEAQEKRKAEAERRKQIKTQNYTRKIQQNAPRKRVKVEKETTAIAKVRVEEKPKSLWGRFVRWLTT